MRSQCICNICTCGKHHCKIRSCIFPCAGNLLGNITEYATQYTEHEPDRVKSFKPKPTPLPEGNMDHKTIHNIDFQPHFMEKPWRHIHKPWEKPPGVLSHLTSYTKDYTPKDVQPSALIRQVSQPIPSGKFIGVPTYKSDYKEWDLIPRRKSKSEPWQKPTEKMAGETTVMKDYIYRDGKPAISYRPIPPVKLKDPLTTLTNYRDIYVEHPLPPVYKRESNKYKKPDVPIDSLTVTMRDYQGKETCRPKNYAPNKIAIQSAVPFDGRTTFRDDYLEWPTIRPKFRENPKYKVPETKIDFVTSHNHAYRKMPLMRTQSFRPKTVRLFPNVFSGTTIYKTDYTPWEITRGPIKRECKYISSDVPFTCISSNKADYVQFPLQNRSGFRPEDTLKTGTEPFDDGTMYRAEYTYKEPVVCPVPFLGTKDAPLQFDRMSESGHLLYKPISAAKLTSQ